MYFVSLFLLILLFNTALLYSKKPELRFRVNSHIASEALFPPSNPRRDGVKVLPELWGNSERITISGHDCYLLPNKSELFTLNKNYTCTVCKSLKS